jgi:hypothetical protein
MGNSVSLGARYRRRYRRWLFEAKKRVRAGSDQRNRSLDTFATPTLKGQGTDITITIIFRFPFFLRCPIGDRPSNLKSLTQLLRLAPHFSMFLQPVLVAAQHGTYCCGSYLQDSSARP